MVAVQASSEKASFVVIETELAGNTTPCPTDPVGDRIACHTKPAGDRIAFPAKPDALIHEKDSRLNRLKPMKNQQPGYVSSYFHDRINSLDIK